MDDKLRWSVEQRLEFIEFRLFWDGHVNRSDLVERFGVSVPQASSDLGRYQEIAPGNIEYDKTAKRYVSSTSFRPVRFKPSADTFLAQIRTFHADLMAKVPHWLDSLPAMDSVPLLRRKVDAAVLRAVLQAIRQSQGIHIHYQSQSSPDPAWRWITPHALGFSGFRWHVRAWCSQHLDFRDFVLARILATRELQAAVTSSALDLAWHQEVNLRLGARSDLESGARQAVEIDYGMQEGYIDIRMRIALSRYFERLLGLDIPSNAVEPNRQPLILLNRTEVEEARTRTAC